MENIQIMHERDPRFQFGQATVMERDGDGTRRQWNATLSGHFARTAPLTRRFAWTALLTQRFAQTAPLE